MIPLPIDPHIDRIVNAVRRSRAAVIAAAPGAGKTTRVPPALEVDGPVILLQPRRVAARAIAARIADERGWTLGREVGWQVRFERRFTAETRLLVVTEGVVTARIQTDPLLSDFQTIVVDEFHERSVHADLALAFARQAWRTRDDLRIVVMSATLDVRSVAAFLDDCPVVEVPGRLYPVDISYTPGVTVAASAIDALRATDGDVLCFLPGAPEIRRAIADLDPVRRDDLDILPLHGSLDADAQDLAFRPSPRRRVIVATNIAETSLTVPGVTAVVDSGLHKVARYDADRGIDSLESERIPADAADQRAGRAGRIAPGIVRRLWDARDRLRPHREPDIHRIDLSSSALDVVAWGGDPRTFEWFERPRDTALDTALTLLARLGLVTSVRPTQLTPLGTQVRRLPLHPRLAQMLVAAGGSRDIARACAVLSERYLLPPRSTSTTSDLLSAIDDWDAVPPHVQRVAEEIQRIAERGLGIAGRKSPIKSATRNSQSALESEAAFRRALLAGYPDRVAQRREPRSPTVLLATGAGATIAPESGVHDGEFLLAVDVHSAVARGLQPRGRGPALRRAQGIPSVSRDERAVLHLPTIRIASIVDREWLAPTTTEVVHRFDKESGTVRARRVERYDALVLAEHPTAPDHDIAAALFADAWMERGPQDEDERVLRRLRFAGHDIDLAETVRLAAHGARRLNDVHLARALSVAILKDLDRNAPDTLKVPSGRHVRLEYDTEGIVSASVKLQELFGLAETPRIGRRREPVVLSLLAPNGRPVQITRDLRSFWDRTYPDVRRELRGRYPKHPWPEDPWKATPTSKTKRR
jgi:ATP-dependent RNA helicase HrpB